MDKKKSLKYPKKKLTKYRLWLNAARQQKIEKQFKQVPYDSLNTGQRKIFDLVCRHLESKTQLLLVVSGQGGSGKSHVLNALRGLFQNRGIKHVVGSFTGCSANLVRGETLHSLFRIGYFSNLAVIPIDTRSIAHLNRVEWLVIDESSFVGCKMLFHISEKLKILHNSDAAMGGVNTILMGDISQLHPVGDVSHYKFPEKYAPESAERKGFEIYRQFFKSFCLMENMRLEPEEVEFKNLLERIRVGLLVPNDLNALREREIKKLSPQERAEFLEQAIVVFPDLESTRKYNDFRLHATGKAIIEIPTLYSKTAPRGTKEKLSLSIGTPVILTHNLNVDGGLFNGTKGVITEFGDLDSRGIPNVIYVHFKGYKGMRFHSLRNDVPIERVETPEKCTITDQSWIKTQYPLELGWSLTCHKIQGSTCRKILIGLPNPDQGNNMFRINCPSLLYVTISRVRRFQDLAFTREFYPSLVRPSRHTAEWLAEQDRLLQMEAEQE